MAGTAKAAVTEAFTANGDWPADNATAGIGVATDIKGKYVDSVTVAANLITITFRAGAPVNLNLRSKTLTMTAGTSTNGDVAWQCGSKPMPAGITAGTTAFAATGAGGTSAQKFRPAECRG